MNEFRILRKAQEEGDVSSLLLLPLCDEEQSALQQVTSIRFKEQEEARKAQVKHIVQIDDLTQRFSALDMELEKVLKEDPRIQVSEKKAGRFRVPASRPRTKGILIAKKNIVRAKIDDEICKEAVLNLQKKHFPAEEDIPSVIKFLEPHTANVRMLG